MIDDDKRRLDSLLKYHASISIQVAAHIRAGTLSNTGSRANSTKNKIEVEIEKYLL